MLLKRGSKGIEVKQLQEKLNTLKYNCGTPDGIFGSKTELALILFQKDNKLNFDGILGEITLNKINELLKPKPRELNILIALDDGHGKSTPGKRTPLFPDGTFMYENQFNSAVVDLLNNHLKRNGFKTLLIAPGDTDVSLAKRVALANSEKANLFISIHANASKGFWGNWGGIETYYYAGKSKDKKLAEIIHKNLLQGTKLRDRGVLTSPFYVIKFTKMPSVLVECAFMDNLFEANLLKSGAYRNECAVEIAKGICEFYGVSYI